MDSWFAFGKARFTGLVLGNFIYITSHAGYEWDRRINNQKSRAIGFVTECDGGCRVSVITTRGYLDPVSILLWYLFGIFYFLAEGALPGNEAAVHIVVAACALLIGVSSFVGDWLTERGQNNMQELITLLRSPVRPWADADGITE